METGQKIKVLIADQQPLFRRGITSVLSHETDIEICSEASNSQELLEKVTTLLPDVVLLDVTQSLPDQDFQVLLPVGYQYFCQCLKLLVG